ncbi:MAG: hypothetical protein ACOZAP_04330 [Pseudomonadota bacterium]|jgi:hypothetical protein
MKRLQKGFEHGWQAVEKRLQRPAKASHATRRVEKGTMPFFNMLLLHPFKLTAR